MGQGYDINNDSAISCNYEKKKETADHCQYIYPVGWFLHLKKCMMLYYYILLLFKSANITFRMYPNGPISLR